MPRPAKDSHMSLTESLLLLSVSRLALDRGCYMAPISNLICSCICSCCYCICSTLPIIEWPYCSSSEMRRSFSSFSASSSLTFFDRLAGAFSAGGRLTKMPSGSRTGYFWRCSTSACGTKLRWKIGC